tara:strand:+ start:190 stop:708 length:519 start_codon:yes stop_codon:yes gene_type:complete
VNINTSQLLALLLAIAVIMLYIFGVEREYSFVTKDVNEYDKLLVRNEKSNRIKKSIISTLEKIAYKEWEMDSLTLIKKKYESMDSVLIQRLEDIKFEFGYSEMLKKINQEKEIRIDIADSKRPKVNIEFEKMLIQHELDSLSTVLGFHRRSLDTLRSLSRYKFYLNQPRFGQ